MKNLFESVTDNNLKSIYEEIFIAREEGVRPRILDPYIQKVRDVYNLSVSDGWKITEELFWEEVARRYFEDKIVKNGAK